MGGVYSGRALDALVLVAVPEEIGAVHARVPNLTLQHAAPRSRAHLWASPCLAAVRPHGAHVLRPLNPETLGHVSGTCSAYVTYAGVK